MVGHVDAQLGGQAPELHVPVDGPHHQPRGARAGRRVVRRGAPPTRSACAPDRGQGTARSSTATTRSSSTRSTYWKTPISDCGDDRGEVCKDYNEWVQGWTEVKGLIVAGDRPHHRFVEAAGVGAGAEEVGGPQARRPLPRSAPAPGRGPARGPVGWLVIGYLGSLARPVRRRLLAPGRVQRRDRAGLHARELQGDADRARLPLDRRADDRDRGLVTVTDALLAFPIAFYMAKVASPRMKGAAGGRGPDAAVVGLPGQGLRLAHDPERGGSAQLGARPVRAQRAPDGDIFRVWLVMSYLWLPFMVIPIYAGSSGSRTRCSRASDDLGAKPWTTFRRVILPLAFPAVVAGSIFTFSLTLGDFIAPAWSRARSSSATSSTPTRSPTTCRWRRRSRWCRSS